MSRRKDLTVTEAAGIINRFLQNDSLYPQEWNDFIECSAKRPEVEVIRRQCHNLDPFVNAPEIDPDSLIELKKLADSLQVEKY